jgi:FHS family L-fucose permease-like MFS transporter
MSDQQLDHYLQMEADAVKIPYLVIALVVLGVTALIYFTTMPEVPVDETSKKTGVLKALKHPQLKWGVVAQFFYVGAQVGVTSFFIRFAKYTGNTPEKEAAFWLGIALFGFMVGRFAGTFLTRFIAPNKLLTLYSFICIFLLSVATFVKSPFAIWALLAIPFFESIMFPTIFSLAIKEIKEDTEIGSSLVVMAIAGGAVFPLMMGLISDQANIQMAYIVPLICFFVIAWFGVAGYKPQKN